MHNIKLQRHIRQSSRDTPAKLLVEIPTHYISHGVLVRSSLQIVKVSNLWPTCMSLYVYNKKFLILLYVSLGVSFNCSRSSSVRLGGGVRVTGFNCPVTLSLAICAPLTRFHFILRF